MRICTGSRLKPFAALAFAAALILGGVATVPAAAQSGGYDNDDYDIGNSQNRNYDNDGGGYSDSSDDGSYQSDQRGYSDTDDEDGYEDGQDAPDVAYFYDELEDQGTWSEHPQYGQVWRPRNVDSEWRPYTRGTWANTQEHGWYWVSDEPFGWATYHYGRWHLDDRYGWVWVPGTRWGPAWVAWRSSNENIGWAPLPPEARWEHGSGLHYEQTIYDSPRYTAYWSFVEPRYITAPRLYTYCAPRARVTTIIYSTRPQTNYVFVNRRIVNRGVSVTSIERVTRTRVTTVRVSQSDNRSYRTVRRETNVINVYRPKLTRAQVRQRAAGKPVLDRAQWRDVDRRPVRRDKRDERKDDRRDVRQERINPANQAPSSYSNTGRYPAAVGAPPNGRDSIYTAPPVGNRSLKNADRARGPNRDRDSGQKADRSQDRDKGRDRDRTRQSKVQGGSPNVGQSSYANTPAARGDGANANGFNQTQQANPRADNRKKKRDKKKNEE